jgi:hypothetical protein
MRMNRIVIALTLLGSLMTGIGCGEPKGHGELVVEQVQKMPPEQRFQLIKENTGMSWPMKEQAIDNLPVSDEQKAAWKAELRKESP